MSTIQKLLFSDLTGTGRCKLVGCVCSYPLFASCSQTEIRANLIVHICLFFQCVLRRRDRETECEFQETQILISVSSCILFKQALWLSAAAPVMIDSMKQKLLVPHSILHLSLLFLFQRSVQEDPECCFHIWTIID